MKAISFILFNFLISERKVSAGDYEAAHYDNPYYTETFYDQIENLYDDVPDLTEFPEGTRVNCDEVRSMITENKCPASWFLSQKMAERSVAKLRVTIFRFLTVIYILHNFLLTQDYSRRYA